MQVHVVLMTFILLEVGEKKKTHFQNFYHTFFIVCDVDSFKHLTVFATPKLSYYLVVILLPEKKVYCSELQGRRRTPDNLRLIFRITPSKHVATHH